MTSGRVLIVRVGAMGDVLHALPAVAALRRQRPELEIDWVVDPRWAPLLVSSEGNAPVVTRALLAETRLWSRRPFSRATLRSILTLRRTLGEAPYDAVVDLQGTLRSAVLARMGRSPIHAGFADPRERAARWSYNRRLRRNGIHVVEQECALLGEALGLSLPPADAELPRDAMAADRIAQRLTVVGSPQRLALLVPTAGWGAKQWPAQRFAVLARALTAEGWTVLINTASSADAATKQILTEAGPGVHAMPCTVAELVEVVRRCGVVVGGDTGPVHLAAALRTPVVALFGPTDPARNGPWGTGSRTVLRSPDSVTSYKRTVNPDPGLTHLGVEAVLAAVQGVTATRRTLRE